MPNRGAPEPLFCNTGLVNLQAGRPSGTGSSCEPDEARGSQRREAYSLYVERRWRPSNEVSRRKLTQYRPSATGARWLALLDLGGAQPQALLVGGLAGTGRGAQPPPRLPVPRPLGRRLHQLDQEPAAEADHPGPDQNPHNKSLRPIFSI